MSDYKQVAPNVWQAKDNYVKKATEFYIAVSVDENGNGGLIALLDMDRFPLVEKPLIGATQADREAIIKEAKEAAAHSKRKVKVLKFTSVEVICEFLPVEDN